MNYQYPRNLRKAAMARRVIALVCIAAFCGVVAGVVFGYALKTHMAGKEMERNTVIIVGQ